VAALGDSGRSGAAGEDSEHALSRWGAGAAAACRVRERGDSFLQPGLLGARAAPKGGLYPADQTV
jgi:hypothetical protein